MAMSMVDALRRFVAAWKMFGLVGLLLSLAWGVGLAGGE